MEALKRLTLALAVLALGGVGCGDDDGGDGDDTNNNVDAGKDGSIDGSTDGSKPDAGDAGYACSTATRPTATMCGGSHCQETPAELRASVTSSSACKTEAELDQFCQLTSVAAVQTCILQNLGASDATAATKACAKTALPSYTDGCLDCFVASAVCAKDKCFNACAADPSAPACDLCRVSEGCIGDFYTCSGIENPIPGL